MSAMLDVADSPLIGMGAQFQPFAQREPQWKLCAQMH